MAGIRNGRSRLFQTLCFLTVILIPASVKADPCDLRVPIAEHNLYVSFWHRFVSGDSSYEIRTAIPEADQALYRFATSPESRARTDAAQTGRQLNELYRPGGPYHSKVIMAARRMAVRERAALRALENPSEEDQRDVERLTQFLSRTYRLLQYYNGHPECREGRQREAPRGGTPSRGQSRGANPGPSEGEVAPVEPVEPDEPVERVARTPPSEEERSCPGPSLGDLPVARAEISLAKRAIEAEISYMERDGPLGRALVEIKRGGRGADGIGRLTRLRRDITQQLEADSRRLCEAFSHPNRDILSRFRQRCREHVDSGRATTRSLAELRGPVLPTGTLGGQNQILERIREYYTRRQYVNYQLEARRTEVLLEQLRSSQFSHSEGDSSGNISTQRSRRDELAELSSQIHQMLTRMGEYRSPVGESGRNEALRRLRGAVTRIEGLRNEFTRSLRSCSSPGEGSPGPGETRAGNIDVS